MMNTKKQYFPDVIGILSSSICLVHCIATPILLTIGASFMSNPIFKYLFILISLVAIIKANANSTSKKISTLLWIAFTGFVLTTIFHDTYHWLHNLGHLFAALIIIGHLLNLKGFKHASLKAEH